MTWSEKEETTGDNKVKTNKLVIGILAHVDAGKTTLSESILYLSGCIKKPGRVDHRDAFLDTFELERARGITIFSKQAVFPLEDLEVTLLDTPGHVDFSGETERTLQVLDCAILVINGADGVQGHTLTLWKLLAGYHIPVFLFVNKMDQAGTDRAALLKDLKSRLNEGCLDFDGAPDSEIWQENLAVCDEAALEKYLETGCVKRGDVAGLIAERKVFPCYFGSALKSEGVKELLTGIGTYMGRPDYPEKFGAKVYKISRDEQGTRLTFMKITGGRLKVKTSLTGGGAEGWQEKADQIRIYSGSRYKAVEEAAAGTVCAVAGLTKTYPGEGLGFETASAPAVLEPVLSYRILLPEGADVHGVFLKLRELNEEEPLLRIEWEERLGEIHAKLMGEVQVEILKSLILDRFGVEVEFGPGNIVYKETIKTAVEGVGHFEPLRHYAEVHLLLEPGEPGSGLVFATACSQDVLDGNWQKLVLTHLAEKEHRGVLTGSPITDMKLTLVTGRAHVKHTEGGDFRQAVYRAVRQGLKKAESVLLEPWYDFTLDIPTELIGRAMSDIQKMQGRFSPPETDGERTTLSGAAPVSEMGDYQTELTAYTGGRGRMFCRIKGYEPCHNAEEVIERIGYDSEGDLENPTGSIFCPHGSGLNVPWYQVEDYMHLECLSLPGKSSGGDFDGGGNAGRAGSSMGTGQSGRQEQGSYGGGGGFSYSKADDKELEAIFTRTYGSGSREKSKSEGVRVIAAAKQGGNVKRETEPVKEYLLVDGYNIIFSWEELKELAEVNIESARNKLMDILCNYQGYKKNTLILVFDAYKVKGGVGEIFPYHNIYVVYTKEAETADQYIEKTVHEIGRKYQVTVASSDALEQVIILGQGGARMSARELEEDIERTSQEIRKEYLEKQKNGRNYLFNYLSEDMAEHMEDVRLGKTEFGGQKSGD